MYFAKLLITYHTDLTISNEKGYTALQLLCRDPPPNLIPFFLENGANMNHTLPTGQSSLRIACQSGELSAVQQLIEGGIDINLSDIYGISPLWIACVKNKVKIVKYLVEKGANVNQPSSKGRTLLWKSCQCGHLEILKTLLISGADMNISDNDNILPINIAKKRNHQDIYDLLISFKQTGMIKISSDDDVETTTANNVKIVTEGGLDFTQYEGIEIDDNIDILDGNDFYPQDSEADIKIKLKRLKKKGRFGYNFI